MKINFDTLNKDLVNKIDSLLKNWFPNGTKIGGEYCIGDLSGKAGNSLKINLSNGKWCDFATEDKGGDLISLYAAIHNLSQICLLYTSPSPRDS